MAEQRYLPDDTAAACQAKEPFVLMVLGDSMAPEFTEGEVIVIDPEGLARAGSFVLAQVEGEYTFRQLSVEGGEWRLRPLNPAYPEQVIGGPEAITGVVVQKKRPGQRGSRKFYR